MNGIHLRKARNGDEQVDLPVIIVDKVTETRGVNDSKAKTDTILLDV